MVRHPFRSSFVVFALRVDEREFDFVRYERWLE
jgi:hypothetical protein